MLAALLTVFVSFAPQDSVAPKDAFRARLERLTVSKRDTDWDAVHGGLLDLLREHRGAAYVRPHLPEVRQRLRDAAFWSAHDRPEESDLVSGDLKRYDRYSGALTIRYAPDQLADFDRSAAPQSSRGPAPDIYEHPVRFRGDFTVTIEAPPSNFPNVILGNGGKNGFLVFIGDNIEDAFTYTKHRLQYFDGDGFETVDSSVPRERKERSKPRPAELEIEVSEKGVVVKLENRRILEAKNPGGALGDVSFFSSFERPGRIRDLELESIELRGTAETAWIEGLVDAALATEREAFDASYREPQELAAWPKATATTRSAREIDDLTSALTFPGITRPDQMARVTELSQLLTGGRLEEFEKLLATTPEGLVPPADRALLSAMLAVVRGSYLDAVRHLDVSLSENDALEVRELRALLLDRVEDFDGAIAAYRALLEEFPEELAYHYALSQAFLLAGRVKDARSHVDRGLALGPADADLLALRAQIVKAGQGPSWERTFRADSEHFEIASEYDQKLCRIARNELEKTHEHLEETFGALPDDVAPVPVYLFGGEAGYERYIDGISYLVPPNTAGIYSARVRQILVWNVSSREDLLHTLRHEAVHHYFHQRLGLTPRWFNEGYAEWIAHARTDSRRWEPATKSEDWAPTFRRYRWKTIPLEDLFFHEDQAFAKNTSLAYAQSWALITMLEQQDDPLLERLWTELEGSIDPGTALRRSLKIGTLRKLQREFDAFIRALREAS